MRPPPWRTIALSALSACHYDLSGVYDDDWSRDAGLDAGQDAGAAGVEAGVAHSLLAGWSNYPGVGEECRRCASIECTQAEQDCLADPECVAYSACVAQAPHPAGQASCRARFAAWVGSGDVRARDLAGPFGQCVFRDRCAVQCEGNVDLSCNGRYAWASTSAEIVPLHLFLNDAQYQSMMLKDVRVKVCRAADLACASPYHEGITDATGRVDLRLPTSFDRAFTGYLQLEGAGVYPTLLKLGWNLALESTVVVSIVNDALFKFSVSVSDVVPDPARGMLQTRMLGCQGVGVRGVRFSVDKSDPALRTWYIADGLPRFDVTETNAVGSGGIFNMPVGRTVVTARRANDDVLVARSEAPIRAGFMTVVVFSPLSVE